MIKGLVKNYVSNTLQNRLIPYTIYSNATQITTYLILSKLGVHATYIAIILMFL